MTAPPLNLAARTEHRRLRRAPDMPQAEPGSPRRKRLRVHCERGIPVASDDGTVLLTDHWHRDDPGDQTVLVRTPYGREDISGIARFIAERGHHVVVQSCRGTFGSGGTFEPLRHEASDGAATLRWLRAQPWATGAVRSWGASYLGATQWASCEGEDAPDTMSIAQSARRFDADMAYPGGGFAIDTLLSWALVLTTQELPPRARAKALLGAPVALARGARAIPPEDAVRIAYDTELGFFRDWVRHSDPEDPWWEPLRPAAAPERLPPVTLVAGWQDLFLTGQLTDYDACL